MLVQVMKVPLVELVQVCALTVDKPLIIKSYYLPAIYKMNLTEVDHTTLGRLPIFLYAQPCTVYTSNFDFTLTEEKK
jgi:hypothetical protein